MSPVATAAPAWTIPGFLDVRENNHLFISGVDATDRKSTRLNSSHSQISYAVSLYQKNTRLNSSHGQISYTVFCLKQPPLAHPPRRLPDNCDSRALAEVFDGLIDLPELVLHAVGVL